MVTQGIDMGNKSSSSPFPEIEVASSHLNPLEINHIKQKFKELSQFRDDITYEKFMQVVS